MLIEARKINEEGFVEDFIVCDSENIPEDYIIDKPQGLYKPRWNGIKWTEGATQEELDELLTESQPAEKIELEKRLAEIEAKSLELENALSALLGV